MALFDQEYQLKNNLLFTVIAIIFGISVFFSLYIGLSGWFLTGWDILGLTAPPNLSSLSVIPLLFWISSISMFITLKFLLTRSLANNKDIILVGSLISSVCGLMMLLLTANTIGLSFVAQNPGSFTWINSFSHPYSQIPFLGALIGLSLGSTLFGIILAWHSPIPKQTNEIDSWREYIEKNPIPWLQWVKVFFITISFIIFFLPLLFFFIHYFILPNPITQPFFNDSDIFFLIGGVSSFFPGPFLYTLVFLILYRKPLVIRLNLFLLSIRTEESPMNGINQGPKLLNQTQKLQQYQSSWKLFGTFTLMELGFILIFTFLRVAIWSEVAILSFWSAFFLYSMFFLIQYT